jgi:hypothetical protein
MPTAIKSVLRRCRQTLRHARRRNSVMVISFLYASNTTPDAILCRSYLLI